MTVSPSSESTRLSGDHRRVEGPTPTVIRPRAGVGEANDTAI